MVTLCTSFSNIYSDLLKFIEILGYLTVFGEKYFLLRLKSPKPCKFEMQIRFVEPAIVCFCFVQFAPNIFDLQALNTIQPKSSCSDVTEIGITQNFREIAFKFSQNVSNSYLRRYAPRTVACSTTVLFLVIQGLRREIDFLSPSPGQ